MKRQEDIFSKNHYDKINWIILTLVFITISVVILFNAFYYQDGYLTADGCNYLSLANNLLEKGSFEGNLLAGEKERAFFSVWPVGYPILIYFVAVVSGLSVFLASKIVNILLVGGILLFFVTLFKEKAYIYSLLLLFSPFIEISSYTLSEIGLLFGIMWFSAALIQFTEKNDVSLVNVISITLACIFSFLSRYIGYFTVWFTILLGLYYLYRKKYRKFLYLIASSTLSSLFICAYLYHNYIQTGFMTGMPRFSSPEGLGTIAVMTIEAFLKETNLLSLGYGNTLQSVILFVATFILQSIVICLYFRKKNTFYNNEINNNPPNQYIMFFLIGSFYYIVLVGNRITTYFSELFYRIMYPGTFLVLIGLVSYVLTQANTSIQQSFKKCLIALAFLSLMNAILLPMAKDITSHSRHISYLDNIGNISTLIKNIPKNSVLVFGDRNILYLRPDISIASPYYKPFFPSKESWPEFLSRVQKKFPDRNVYVMLQNSNFWESSTKQDLSQWYHKSVTEFIQKYRGQAFVQIY